ncbi:MAG TPA: O-antigen ligase family protein [Candidatus Sulfotelmatobacter sp.]|nr:O-antigen ligase family protein [Candidatus Sulfotelmatobacter sp.]
MIIFYLLVWVLPLVNHPFWGRKIGPLTVFEYLGIVSLLYTVFHSFSRGRFPRIFRTWPVRLFFLLYLVAVVSAFVAGQGVRLSNSSLIIYTSSMFLFVITISVVDSLPRLRWTILALVGSYAFASLYMMREWQVGHHIWGDFRPGWIVGDPNFFSAAAIFSISLAFCFMQGKRPGWEKFYCLGCMIGTLIALMLCGSRGGFLGLGVAVSFLLWRTPNRIRNFALLAVLVVPLTLILPASPIHRWLHPSGSEIGSEENHLVAWQAGWKMIEAHPLTGIGLGNFKPMMPLYAPPGTKEDSIAHNMFIEVAAELGLPALVLFVGIFVGSFRLLGKLRRRVSAPMIVREAAGALQAGVLGIAVAGSFVSSEYQKTTWMGFALAACLVPLARSAKAAKTEAPVAVLPNEEAPVAAGMLFD